MSLSKYKLSPPFSWKERMIIGKDYSIFLPFNCLSFFLNDLTVIENTCIVSVNKIQLAIIRVYQYLKLIFLFVLLGMNILMKTEHIEKCTKTLSVNILQWHASYQWTQPLTTYVQECMQQIKGEVRSNWEIECP